jgi:hypothetical protein
MFLTEYKPHDSHKCDIESCTKISRFLVIADTLQYHYCGSCLARVVSITAKAIELSKTLSDYPPRSGQ